MPYSDPEPLESRHLVHAFDCGEPELDEWLKKHALAANNSGSARVFVTTSTAEADMVVGYYALAAAQIEPKDATERLAKGQPARPISVVLLARLAVRRDHQNRGVGASLLQNAMRRALIAAEEIGIRAMVVHAKNENARTWYLQYGFEESPTDELHLILLMKDLRKFIRSQG